MDISFNLRSIRKSIAGLTTLALLATMSFAGVAKAQTFSDVSSSDWFYTYVESLVDQGVIEGYDDGTFGAADELTREQAAKVMVLAALGEDQLDADYDAGFSDVDADAWYAVYINTAAKNGIVNGYTDEEGELTGVFGVGDNITRAAFAKMAVDAFALPTDTTDAPHFSDVSEGAWYYEYVETAYNNSVIDGYSDGTFKPGSNVNRAEASKMVYNSKFPELRYEETPSCEDGYTLVDDVCVEDVVTCDDGYTLVDDVCVDDETGCEEGYEYDTDTETCVEVEVEVPSSTATLTVEMGDAISGSTLPKGATSVEILNLVFTADGDAAELDGLTLHRTGVGSSSDFTSVYLYQGDDRLTTGRSIASDDNEVTFGSLNLALADGESVTLTVVVDLSSTATTGDENALEVTSADKIDTDAAEVTGTFSMTGSTFTVSGASAGTITIDNTGSVPNPTIGDVDAEIAEFQLTASASEDLVLERITIIVKGTTSNEAYSDFKLMQAGTTIATSDTITEDDLVTFVIDGTYNCDSYGYTGDGYCIGRGNSKTFSMYTTIGTAADPLDTIITYLEQSTDLVARGLVYGYGAQVSDDNFDASGEGQTATIQGGQFTISQDGPTSGDIAINAKDVILNKMTFTSERNVEIKALTGSYTATGSGLTDGAVANFTDLKLVRLDDEGEIVETLMGPGEFAAVTEESDTQTYAFTDAWTMSEGESVVVALTCDIANYASLADSTITATLSAVSTTAGIKDTDTNEYISDIVPSSAIAGSAMTIKAATVTVSLASTPTSDTFVKGTSGVNLATFALGVGSAMDVNISQIVISAQFDEDGDGDYDEYSAGVDPLVSGVDVKNVVTTLWLEDSEGNQLGDYESFSASNATFDGLGWDIEAGDTELLYVYGNLSSSAPFNSTNDAVSVDIDTVADDMTITDAEGNTVTATGNNVNGVADAPTVVMTVSGGGTLAIAEATADPVNNQIAVAGDTEVLVGRFKLTSTDEDFEVKDMTFTATGTVNGAYAASRPDTLKRDIATLTLKYPTSTATPDTLDGEIETSMAGSNVVFTSLGLMVPKDDSIYVELYADFNNHYLETGGAYSDDGLMFVLNTGDSDDKTFIATGQGSGTGYVATELSDVTLSNVTYLYRTVPTIANETALGSSLITGSDREVYRFKVSASSTEELALMYLTLDVSQSGLVTGTSANSLTNSTSAETDVFETNHCASGSGLTLSNNVSTAPWYVTEYLQTTKVGSGCYDSGNGHAKIEMNIASTGTSRNSGAIVSAGGYKIYSVYADVYADSDTSTTSSLSIRINSDDAYEAAAVYNGLGYGLANTEESGVATGLIWTDYGRATGTHGEMTAEYMNGYKVSGMPVSYMTLS